MRWHSDQIWSVHKELQCASSEQPLFVRGSEACQLVSTRNCSLILPSVAANIWLTGNEPCPIRQVPPLTPFHCIVPKLVFVCLATLITFFFFSPFLCNIERDGWKQCSRLLVKSVECKGKKKLKPSFEKKTICFFVGFFLHFCHYLWFNATPAPPKKMKMKIWSETLGNGDFQSTFRKRFSHTFRPKCRGKWEPKRA